LLNLLGIDGVGSGEASGETGLKEVETDEEITARSMLKIATSWSLGR
jgi:hypothetical protein